jgi:hypothetical protein
MIDNSLCKSHLIQSLALGAGLCGLYTVALQRRGPPGHEGKAYAKVCSPCLSSKLIFMSVQ